MRLGGHPNKLLLLEALAKQKLSRFDSLLDRILSELLISGAACCMQTVLPPWLEGFPGWTPTASSFLHPIRVMLICHCMVAPQEPTLSYAWWSVHDLHRVHAPLTGLSCKVPPQAMPACSLPLHRRDGAACAHTGHVRGLFTQDVTDWACRRRDGV